VTQALLVLFAAVNPIATATGLATALSSSGGSPGAARADGDAAAAGGRARLITLLVGVDVVAGLVVLLAWLSDPILDLLDVSPPTFRIAAAVVVGASGLLWLLRGASLAGADDPRRDDPLPAAGAWRGLAVPVLVPVLVTPAVLAAGIAMGADHGVGAALLAVAVALVLTTLLAAGLVAGRRPPAVAVLVAVGARLVGVLAIVMALALAVDGVKTV
jgi:small neutral amino acid transporter SnatA (MarC family)